MPLSDCCQQQRRIDLHVCLSRLCAVPNRSGPALPLCRSSYARRGTGSGASLSWAAQTTRKLGPRCALLHVALGWLLVACDSSDTSVLPYLVQTAALHCMHLWGVLLASAYHSTTQPPAPVNLLPGRSPTARGERWARRAAAAPATAISVQPSSCRACVSCLRRRRRGRWEGLGLVEALVEAAEGAAGPGLSGACAQCARLPGPCAQFPTANITGVNRSAALSACA